MSKNISGISYEYLVSLCDDLDKALVNDPESKLEKAGLIKFFELAYEQSWKIIKKVLMKNYSIEVFGSRDAFREAAKIGLIEDPVQWFEFVDDRNETVRAYDESKADEIISDLDDFVAAVKLLIERLDHEANKSK